MFFENYKNDTDYTQIVCKDFSFRNVNVINIKSNTYYENISFYGITFKNLNLNHTCFHNCSFLFCNFENVSSEKEKDLSTIFYPRQGFSCCNFTFCKFENCKLNELFFSIGTLKCVDFKDTFFQGVIFQMNAFSQVTFSHNCELHSVNILSPSRMLDIQFINDGGHISIDSNCHIGNFRYHDFVNITDVQTHNNFKKVHYEKVSSTYYSFEQLLASNYLLDSRSNYYYQRKKAETRSQSFLHSLSGRIAEAIFGYGEYPFRSMFSLIFVTIAYAPLYMLTGFNTGSEIINYSLNLDFLLSWSKLKWGHLLESLYYSFFTLITVGQGTPYPTSDLTKLISSSELLLGATLITTFTATLFRKITK